MKHKSVLLAASIHWLAINVAFTLHFIFRIITEPWYADYTRYTPLQYFVKHAFNDADSLVFAASLLLIEINYQYLFTKLRLPVFILVCLLTGVFSSIIVYYLNMPKFEDRNLPFEVIPFVAGYTLLYAVVRDYIYRFLHKKEVQLQQFKNELDTLKAQLNPHFLFNSLNYVYGTALTEKAPLTADAVDKLSEMMRYTITGIHENFVPLENELNFINQYISLQQVRLPEKENIRIKVQTSSPLTGLSIAPLLLLPFIENAFKYGISMDEPCFVDINVDVSDSTLKMEIMNSICSRPIEITGNNTGIKNTIKRLNLLYPDNYNLSQLQKGNEYKVLLTLKLTKTK
jgi:sensor histidine kinase YesM